MLSCKMARISTKSQIAGLLDTLFRVMQLWEAGVYLLHGEMPRITCHLHFGCKRQNGHLFYNVNILHMISSTSLKDIPSFGIIVNDIYIESIYALYLSLLFPDNPDIQRDVLSAESPEIAYNLAVSKISHIREDWRIVSTSLLKWCADVACLQDVTPFRCILANSLCTAKPKLSQYLSSNKQKTGTESENLYDILIYLYYYIERQRLWSYFKFKFRKVSKPPKIANVLFLGKHLQVVHDAKFYFHYLNG